MSNISGFHGLSKAHWFPCQPPSGKMGAPAFKNSEKHFKAELNYFIYPNYGASKQNVF
jgi:hypothetical protein